MTVFRALLALVIFASGFICGREGHDSRAYVCSKQVKTITYVREIDHE